jgi:DNA gyrase/topoisomerase IV subunit A
MSFSDKIDEWITEAETRPASALMILKLVANRLRDLSERNEQLLAENIALQDGTRAEETQKRIAHLEYQLDLLKRRLGGDQAALLLEQAPVEAAAPTLLIYNAHGRILRLNVDPSTGSPVPAVLAQAGQVPAQTNLGRILGELAPEDELPRILCVAAHEEVLLLFTSGRISTRAVSEIPAMQSGADWSWDQAALPDEPHAGERLACLMPLSRLALADFFLQGSRRGCIKKTLVSLAQSVLDNRYLGRGALQKADQPCEALLCSKKDRFALVTYEGRLLGLDIDALSYAAEERIKLETSDYVIAAFVPGPEQSILCLTQNGKIVQRESGFLDLARSPSTRGQAMIPPSRLDQGTRFVGAAAVRDDDQIVVLDAEGRLTLHLAGEAAGAGSVRTSGAALALGVIPAAKRGTQQP